jgi:nucleotide-binding universal stress UspA family protein
MVRESFPTFIEGANMPMTAAHRLIQFNKIAVLTDLERDAEKLLRYAGSLGRWYGSQLLLVHGCSPDEHIDRREPQPHWPAGQEALKEADEKKFKALAQKFHLQDLVTRIVVREAGISSLLKEVEGYRPNLIMLATHGREGVRKWLAGSVCEEVFRKVNWPVLVLGPALKDTDPGEQKQFQRVLLASDMSSVSLGALQYAASIAHDHEAQLTALYVDENAVETFSFDRTMTLRRFQDWLEERADGLAEALSGVQCIVESGKPESEIVRTANERHVDLVVLGAHGRKVAAGISTHLAGGTAYEVICNASCPVLIVPEPH